jgi:hypothetical protein
MADEQILSTWRLECSKSRNNAKRNSCLLATEAVTVADAVAILRSAVVTRREPRRNNRTGKPQPISAQYERSTRILEIEANKLERMALTGREATTRERAR